tara:strand:+ start:50 stop:475 length:426 start_codon:yes stop_codon:yes gene_type:complete
MIKLGKLIKEAYAWERNKDGSLPTLADAIKSHKAAVDEKADLRIKGKIFTISPANGNVNIAGPGVNKEYSVEVSAFINISVKIVNVVLNNGNLKITANAMGMTKEGELGQKQVDNIFASVLQGRSNFKIAGEENTFIFTEV